MYNVSHWSWYTLSVQHQQQKQQQWQSAKVIVPTSIGGHVLVLLQYEIICRVIIYYYFYYNSFSRYLSLSHFPTLPRHSSYRFATSEGYATDLIKSSHSLNSIELCMEFRSHHCFFFSLSQSALHTTHKRIHIWATKDLNINTQCAPKRRWNFAQYATATNTVCAIDYNLTMKTYR